MYVLKWARYNGWLLRLRDATTGAPPLEGAGVPHSLYGAHMGTRQRSKMAATRVMLLSVAVWPTGVTVSNGLVKQGCG